LFETFEATPPRALSRSPFQNARQRSTAWGESSLSIREFALCDWLPMQDLPKSGRTRSREAPLGEKAGLLRRALLAFRAFHLALDFVALPFPSEGHFPFTAWPVA
jgi:hypothetical protein